ncbi:MAG: LytTR family DNA-binding domain-containing protein [Muribaculaceae bacterium]|nr:LytTR family DNA-binding domain-containing protein [Muribaculaceae bacterium]
MIRCIVIDDEPIALAIIKEFCRRYGDIDVECFTSPVEGMHRIEQTRPDIVMLDIEMNSHNGLTLARALPKDTCLIFTTAYPQYALDGFNLDAVDFLHKPIFYPRFERAIRKAEVWIAARNGAPVAPRQVITLKVEHKNVVVDIQDIAYIEAMDNYVKVYRIGKPTVVSQITMKEVESMLPDDGFIRVHRSYIVSLRQIEKFSNRKIFLRNYQQPIPVGRTYIAFTDAS